MSHRDQRLFCESVRARFPHYFVGANVLDVGSLDINGSCRSLFKGGTYLGIDMVAGKGVDRVCRISDLPRKEKFSVVLSTEALEHDPTWGYTFNQMQEFVSPGGLLMVTCAGPERKEHGTVKHPMPGMQNTDTYYDNLSPGDLMLEFDEKLFAAYEFTYQNRNCDTYLWAIRKPA